MSEDYHKYMARKAAEKQAAGGGFRQPGASMVAPESPTILTPGSPTGGLRTSSGAVRYGDSPAAARSAVDSAFTFPEGKERSDQLMQAGMKYGKVISPDLTKTAYGQNLAHAGAENLGTAMDLPEGPARQKGLGMVTAEYGGHFPKEMVSPLTAGAGFKETAGQPYQQTKEGVQWLTQNDPEKKLRDQQAADLAAAAKAKQRGEVGARSDADYKAMVGGGLPKEGEVAYGKHIDARNYAQANPEDKEAYKRRYQENLQLEKYEPLFTPEAMAAHGLTITPEMQQNQQYMREFMLKFGPRLQQKQQTQATSGDPGWDRLSGAVNRFGQGAVKTGEALASGAAALNRGVREVVPGASMVITPQGQLQNPFRSVPGTPEIHYNPDPFVQ